MKFKNTNQSKGFTIIETLIVLAIAATIFLVVFLAVTALYRSTRNTARKDDAAAMLAAIGDFASDNNGALPMSMAVTTAPTYALSSTVTGSVNVDLKLAHYTAATFDTAAGGTTIASTANTTDILIVDENSTCNGSSAAVAGSTGAYAIIYTIESGSAYVQQCIGS
jgi:prepilin-type N-terminal cleavage/methylation domain-containing protein